MSDRELLELAAKAAGYTLREQYAGYPPIAEELNAAWNPLTDDGDALRLAVKLGLLKGHPALLHEFASTVFPGGAPQDPYAATRRAIVRAAAEIGRGMK